MINGHRTFVARMLRIYIVHGGKFIRSQSFVQLKTSCVDEIAVDGCSTDRAYETHIHNMQFSKNTNLDCSGAFYKSLLPVQKTSAEIINEARSTLRMLRTQRPFTPRDERRKLFGSTSSRTPENRPPSAFSLHSSSFESVESRPVSCARLSPLDHKPKLLSSASNYEDYCVSPPLSPVDSEEIRKVSKARARLFKTVSCGNLLPDKLFLPNDCKSLYFEEQFIPRSDHESFSQKLPVQFSLRDACLPPTYTDHHNKTGENFPSQMRNISFPAQFSRQSDQFNRQESPLSYPDYTEMTKSATKSGTCYILSPYIIFHCNVMISE
uniref:Uncharacterized protein n=2 Tax=Laticauda laticaudata TaxID=8630 RepID=A0A8C5SHY3_LATLA